MPLHPPKIIVVERPLTVGEYVASRYVEELERRLETMERLLKSLSPGFQSGRGSEPPIDEVTDITKCRDIPSTMPISRPSNQLDFDLPSTDVDASIADMAGDFGEMTIEDGRYLGKASGFHLARTITAFRNKDRPVTSANPDNKGDPHHPGPQFHTHKVPATVERLIANEHATNATLHSFPDLDLATSLVDLYFENYNSIYPLLHRPSFQRQYATATYDTNHSFRALCFAVFAIGSRFSNDPRIYPANVPESPYPKEHTRGLDYFNACVKSVTPFCLAATLEDLQALNLSIVFLVASASPITAWGGLGFAVRRAQDVGAHRRLNARWNVTPLEDQLRKRAWWSLYAFDRLLSASLGRPLAAHDEDIDLDYPLDLDDATLDEWNFAGPSAPVPKGNGQPTAVSGFNCFVDLQRTTGKALRTVYAIKDHAVRHDPYPQWEQRIVAELDSDLNRWLEKVPQHLKWSPTTENKIWLTQSAFIFTTYYTIQILVHRDFLSPERKGLLNFPSLAICTNAARSSSHVLDNLRRRGMLETTWYSSPFHALTAGMVLLINVYAKRGSPNNSQLSNQAVLDVQKCLDVLEAFSRNSFIAFKAGSGLRNLAALGDVPPSTNGSTGGSNKRERSDEGESTGTSSGGSPNQGRPQVESTTTVRRRESVKAGGTTSSLGKRQRELPLTTEDLSQSTFGGDQTFLQSATGLNAFGSSPPVSKASSNYSSFLGGSQISQDDIAQLLSSSSSNPSVNTQIQTSFPSDTNPAVSSDLFNLLSGFAGSSVFTPSAASHSPRPSDALPPSVFEFGRGDNFGGIGDVGGLGGANAASSTMDSNQGVYDWDAWSFLNALQNTNTLDLANFANNTNGQNQSHSQGQGNAMMFDQS
ncbi:hypothetical protein BT69DRAFT_1303281 [Atractiella rhizophila]|nr:hypothetical protein BT69DRAFT_1303281 [Atractiella rhizophila]